MDGSQVNERDQAVALEGARMEDKDIMQAVRESAMLADITISMWEGKRVDKNLMDSVKNQHGASGDVGTVNKKLLAGVEQKLKDVRSAFTTARSLHYAHTLPWVSDPHAERQRGPRLLPHLLFQKYLDALSRQKRVAMQLLDEFIADYPVLIAQAKANLGGMANDDDYPTEAELRSKFRISFDWEPIPSGASFKGLPDHTIERLAKALHAKQERMIQAATKAMWDDVKDRVGHLLGRLADPEARFKSSTIENVKELVTLLPGFNLTGDAAVQEIIEDINQMLDGVDAKELRDNLTTRSDVANKAQALVDKMSKWGV